MRDHPDRRSTTQWELVLATLLLGVFLGCTEDREVLWTRPPAPVGSEGGAGANPVRPPVWRSLSGQKYHTCTLRAGQPWCWGRNDGGTLGAFGEPFASTPVLVPASEPLVSLATGEGYTCGVTATGAVYCWGRNDLGQLGVGDFVSRAAPTRVALPAPARQLGAGDAHVCAVSTARALYCWGQNSERQLGLGGAPDAPPEVSPIRVGDGDDWSQVAPGQGHTCGIRGGELWCWGRNTQGQVGLEPALAPQPAEPIRIDDRTDWVQVSCGQHDTCALRADGSFWCLGGNEFGVHATGDRSGRFTPIRVGTRDDFVDGQVNNFNACLLTRDGDLLCWGWNDLGALGQGDTVERLTPTLLPPPGAYSHFTMAWQHNCAGRADGSIWCVGRNAEGELGDGTTEGRQALVPVRFP